VAVSLGSGKWRSGVAGGQAGGQAALSEVHIIWYYVQYVYVYVYYLQEHRRLSRCI